AAFLKSHNFETGTTRGRPERLSDFLNATLAMPDTQTIRLAQSAEPALQTSVTKTGSAFDSIPAAALTGVQLKVASGLAARLISQPDLNEIKGFPAVGGQLSASITVNRHGEVTHAFIDPRSRTEQPVPVALLNTLYRLRFKTAEKETQGRVAIYSLSGEKSE
ncbi:hypothetical protein ACFLQY_05780, partial [Verrucomicrobiota bacterium]